MLMIKTKLYVVAIFCGLTTNVFAQPRLMAWNGKFYTHFIDEDPTVKRNLGVDEKSQIAQSNAYSLNRDIRPDQQKAIIETYLNLKNNLPVGSPGEWYAIYPPFQRGFGSHGEIWQYMNGGVGGHVAGELALGAYHAGYEQYGTDTCCIPPPNPPLKMWWAVSPWSTPTALTASNICSWTNT
jgi:hypothetical protein